MELEGSNWTFDMLEEFREKKGYDLSHYLPFILFKTGAMGNVTDFKYGVSMSPEIENMIRRMRYDFEMTKAELLEERFIKTYTEWCRRIECKIACPGIWKEFFPS